MTKNITLLVVVLSFVSSLQAQDDLLTLLEGEQKDASTRYTSATFKSTRIVNGHSVEVRPGGVLDFIISHRFGRINEGIGQLYGLDDSQVRIALEYGISDKFNIGFGRSSVGKVLDGYLKYKILRQSEGAKASPVSVSAFTSMAIVTGPGAFGYPEANNRFSQRLTYAYQLLIARKMSSKLSLQITPTLIHRNTVPTRSDPNGVVSVGFGGRYKLTNRIAFNTEYYHLATDLGADYHPSFSVGFDIETGGHVFQLHITNSRAMIEKGFVAETNGTWGEGAIHYGFNISRVFNLKPEK